MYWIESVSWILNAVLGGGLITLLTLRSVRKRANADCKQAKHEAQKKEIDLVTDLQNSNDLLSTKLNELLKEIVEVKMQNAELKIAMNNIVVENEQLRKEVADLSVQLSNIKAVKR